MPDIDASIQSESKPQDKKIPWVSHEEILASRSCYHAISSLRTLTSTPSDGDTPLSSQEERLRSQIKKVQSELNQMALKTLQKKNANDKLRASFCSNRSILDGHLHKHGLENLSDQEWRQYRETVHAFHSEQLIHAPAETKTLNIYTLIHQLKDNSSDLSAIQKKGGLISKLYQCFLYDAESNLAPFKKAYDHNFSQESVVRYKGDALIRTIADETKEWHQSNNSPLLTNAEQALRKRIRAIYTEYPNNSLITPVEQLPIYKTKACLENELTINPEEDLPNTSDDGCTHLLELRDHHTLEPGAIYARWDGDQVFYKYLKDREEKENTMEWSELSQAGLPETLRPEASGFPSQFRDTEFKRVFFSLTATRGEISNDSHVFINRHEFNFLNNFLPPDTRDKYTFGCPINLSEFMNDVANKSVKTPSSRRSLFSSDDYKKQFPGDIKPEVKLQSKLNGLYHRLHSSVTDQALTGYPASGITEREVTEVKEACENYLSAQYPMNRWESLHSTGVGQTSVQAVDTFFKTAEDRIFYHKSSAIATFKNSQSSDEEKRKALASYRFYESIQVRTLPILESYTQPIRKQLDGNIYMHADPNAERYGFYLSSQVQDGLLNSEASAVRFSKETQQKSKMHQQYIQQPQMYKVTKCDDSKSTKVLAVRKDSDLDSLENEMRTRLMNRSHELYNHFKQHGVESALIAGPYGSKETIDFTNRMSREAYYTGDQYREILSHLATEHNESKYNLLCLRYAEHLKNPCGGRVKKEQAEGIQTILGPSINTAQFKKPLEEVLANAQLIKNEALTISQCLKEVKASGYNPYFIEGQTKKLEQKLAQKDKTPTSISDSRVEGPARVGDLLSIKATRITGFFSNTLPKNKGDLGLFDNRSSSSDSKDEKEQLKTSGVIAHCANV